MRIIRPVSPEQMADRLLAHLRAAKASLIAERADIYIRASLSAQMPDDEDSQLAWQRNLYASNIEIEGIARKLEVKAGLVIETAPDTSFDIHAKTADEPDLPEALLPSFRTLIARIDTGIAKLDIHIGNSG